MKKKVFMLLVLICCLPLCAQANSISLTFSVVMPNPIEISSNSEGATTSTPEATITTEKTNVNGIPALIQTALAK